MLQADPSDWPLAVSAALARPEERVSIWTDPEALTGSDFIWRCAAMELVACPVSTDSEASSASTCFRAAARLVSSLVAWRHTGSLELRYLRSGVRSEGTQLLFIARGSGPNDNEAHHAATQILAAVRGALPSGYVTAPTTAPSLVLPDDLAWHEVRRLEERLEPARVDCEAAYYYIPHTISGDGSGWPAFFETIALTTDPTVVSILLVPTILTWQEREAISFVQSALSFYGTPQQDHDIFANPIPLPADAGAAFAAEVWQRHLSELQRATLMRVAVATTQRSARTLAASLAQAISTSPESASRVAISEAGTYSDRQTVIQSLAAGTVLPWGGHSLWREDDAPRSLVRVPYLFAEHEAAAMTILPVPGPDGCPGFGRARPDDSRHLPPRRDIPSGMPALRLGLTQDEPVGLPLQSLSKHVLVAGSSGSGKTTSVETLLVQLWRDHGIPWLVIEPRKREYRSLAAISGLEPTYVFTLGNDQLGALRLNPLAIPAGSDVTNHISTLMTAFKAAIPMDPQSPLPYILDEALHDLFDEAESESPPTLRDLLPLIKKAMERADYVGEAKNVGPALDVRLRSLLRGGKGLLFDSVESTPWSDVMSRPTVFELDAIDDASDRKLIMSFLLKLIRHAARTRDRTPQGRPAHVVVFEEAHQLLRGDVTDESPSNDAIRELANAIAELRALGEAFIFADQEPKQLVSAVVANSATKILHRIEHPEDRSAMLESIGADERTSQTATWLKDGEAIIRLPGLPVPVLTQVQPEQGVDTARRLTDQSLADHMQRSNESTARLLPYSLCTRDICREGCSPTRRGRGLVNGRQLALPETLEDRVEQARTLQVAVADAYCSLVHAELRQPLFRGRASEVAIELQHALFTDRTRADEGLD